MRSVRLSVAVACFCFLALVGYLLAQRPEATTVSGATPGTPGTAAKPKSITPSNQGVSAGMMYHRVYVISPLIGSGKQGDPQRPIFAPAAPQFPIKGAAPPQTSAASASASASHAGLLGYQMQLSDDGRTALVEMVFSDPVAFQLVMRQEASDRNVSVPAVPATEDASPAAVSSSLSSALQSAVPGLQIFERGKATDAQILAAFQKYKAKFSFQGTVRPQ